MVFTTEHSMADNGMEKLDRPWRTLVRVDHAPVYTSFHETRVDAERARDKMHKSYLQVHSSPLGMWAVTTAQKRDSGNQ